MTRCPPERFRNCECDASRYGDCANESLTDAQLRRKQANERVRQQWDDVNARMPEEGNWW